MRGPPRAYEFLLERIAICHHGDNKNTGKRTSKALEEGPEHNE